MGCGSSKDKSPPPAATAAAADGFVNGSPAAFFPYDERRRCTERGNGLLFRLTNRATRQWAFYNDSDALAFHVAVTFSPHSRVAAIGRTALAALPGGGGFVAKTVVAPRATAAFVEGEIDGFDAVYQAVVVADTREEREKEKEKRKRKEKGKEKEKGEDKEKGKGKEKSRRKEEGKGKDKGKSKETKGEEEM